MECCGSELAVDRTGTVAKGGVIVTSRTSVSSVQAEPVSPSIGHRQSVLVAGPEEKVRKDDRRVK